MTELTRRAFVARSAGTAAGMTAIGALVTDQAQADGHAHPVADAHRHPVVAYVRDARKGEVSLMSGDREVTVRDRKLAAQITRAAR
jgi:hypothetical protein